MFKTYEAAARRYDDGNETLSSVLDKLAVSEDADTKLAESAYGEAMSDILLRQAVGIDVIECPGSDGIASRAEWRTSLD